MSVYKHIFMYKFAEPTKRHQHVNAILHMNDSDLEDVHAEVHHQFYACDPGHPHEDMLGRLLDHVEMEKSSRELKRERGLDDE